MMYDCIDILPLSEMMMHLEREFEEDVVLMDSD